MLKFRGPTAATFKMRVVIELEQLEWVPRSRSPWRTAVRVCRTQFVGTPPVTREVGIR